MTSWAGRLEAATDKWRQGDLDGAASGLREVVASGDDTVVPEASFVLGRVLEDRGDRDGAQAAHRSVIATDHPVFAQRSALSLGMMLADDERWAPAHRPLRIASAGADAEIAVMADVVLVRVLRMLGDLAAAGALLERVRRGDNPAVVELTEGLEVMPWPDDGGERERQAWDAYEAICGLLDADADADDDVDDAREAETAENAEIAVTGLNRMLSHGIPELCTRAAFRLYGIYAERGEFVECRRVVEHAIAVGDPAERCMAEKLLGAVLFDLGEPIEAREAYRRAAEDHRPEVRLDALIQESKFVRELGDEEDARAILWRVVESGHPRFALEARACLGQVYSEAGEVADALACWRVVLDADSPFHRGAVLCLGMLLHGLPAGDPRRMEVIALLRQATELDDPDVAFQAKVTLAQSEAAVRGPDEELEQAIDDNDAALERLRDGDLAAARALLRRVTDAGIAGQSERAARTLALLELGEGDAEQAAELLEYVAAGDDFAHGFAAAVDLHLIVSSWGAGGVADTTHPVLAALVDYQRLGRETGIARYQECAGHADPVVAALAKNVLAQTYVTLGAPRSAAAELLDEAAGCDDPLALSQAAVLAWIIHGDDAGHAIGLLRRARTEGHPALVPWVAYALGAALQGRVHGDDAHGSDAHGSDGDDADADEALAAYAAVSDSAHPGLAIEGESRMLQLLEGRGDLAGAAEVHERIVARGDRLQAPRSAWLLGYTRVRLDDFDAARAAYDLVTADHPELAAAGLFARRLLDRDFDGAAAALAAMSVPGREDSASEREDPASERDDGDDHRVVMATELLIEAAHAWQRTGESAAADAALLLATDGVPRRTGSDRAQEAALFLGALRNDSGDHAGAAEAWARAAAGDDEHRATIAAKALGEVRHRLGDLAGAAAAYRQALAATDPDDDDHDRLLDDLTSVLVAAGRVTEARTLVADHYGDGLHVTVTIARVLEENGDLDGAAGWYREAIDRGAGDDGDAAVPVATARAMLARLLAGRGEPARAAEYAAGALAALDDLAAQGDETAADSATVVAFELGGYLTEAGDAGGAREAYERAATAADPQIRVSAKERLGTASPRERALLRLHEGDREAARDLLSEEYGSSVVAELHVTLVDGRFTHLRPLLEQVAGTEHADRAANLVLTAALEALREGPDEAAGLHELVLEFGTPEQVTTVCDNVGHAYDLAGDTDAAIAALTRGAAVDHPSALACLRRLLGLLALTDDHAAIEAAARRAIASGDPETVTVGIWTLGGLARAHGDLAEATARYREAIEGADPQTVPYIQVELGQVLRERGETAAAHRAMESVLGCDDPGQVLLAGTHLGGWLGEAGRLAGAAEAFGTAVAAGLRHPNPDEHDRECHQMALNNLASVAFEADEAGDHAVAVRALHLAAAGGAHGDAVRIAKDYATVAAERGDLNAVRTYLKGAAAFPPDGDQSLLVELAEVLAEHGRSTEARALLEPLIGSGDPHVRLAATTRLLPILQDAGEDDRALEVAARAAGQPLAASSAEAESVAEPAAESVAEPAAEEAEIGAARVQPPSRDVPEHSGTDDAGDVDGAGDVGDVGGTDAAADDDVEGAGERDDPGTDEEIERRRAELFAIVDQYEGTEGTSLVDPLRVYLRNEAGTSTAGEAGQRVIRTARQVWGYDPEQARQILELVVEYGEPAEAATACDDIGDICDERGDTGAAIAAYRKGAAVDDPAALLPLRSLMLALCDVEDWDGVAQNAQRAVSSRDPHTAAVGYWLWGDSRRHRGDSDGAVRLYRQGIGAGHRDMVPRLRYELARTLRDRGEAAEARIELERAAAEATDPNMRAVAGSLLGDWTFDEGDVDAAAAAFGGVAAIEVDPGDADDRPSLPEMVDAAAHNLFVIANRAFTEGKHPVAVRALTLAAQAGRVPEALSRAKRRATECTEEGDRAAALLYVDGAVGFVSDPGPDEEIELADLLASVGRLDEARARYERLTGHADAGIRLVAAGRLAPLPREGGDREGPADVTGRMTGDSVEAELDPAETGLDPAAQALLGSMLGVMQSEQGDREGALRTLRAAADGGEPTALFMLGQELLEAGELTEARETLARVPETEVRIGRRALVALGQSYHEEDPDRARELYLRALETPDDPGDTGAMLARMYLGSLAKRDRDWPEALRWYQQVIDSGGRTGDVSQAPMAAAHLGELAYWLGDRDSAVRFYELTLAAGTDNPSLVGEAAYRLGEIRHGDGELDLAGRYLRQAVESGDDTFAAQASALLGDLPELPGA